MRKLLVFLVLFVVVFLFTFPFVFAEQTIEEKKTTTMIEQKNESSGTSVSKGRAGSVKKPIVKKKFTPKKYSGTTTAKSARQQRSYKRIISTTTSKKVIDVKKEEPPKGPSPCDVCDLRPRGFLYTNVDTDELQGSLKCSAQVTFKYSEPATQNTVGRIIVGEPIDVPFNDGARVNMYTTDPLQQKAHYIYWLEAKTAEGAVCKSNPSIFWAQPPEPIYALAKKDSYWGTFLHCMSGIVIGGGATILKASKDQAAWIAGGLFLGGYMTDGNLTSGDITAFSLCMAGGSMLQKKETASQVQTQANPPAATPPPVTPPPSGTPGANPPTPVNTGPGPNPNPTAPGPNPTP